MLQIPSVRLPYSTILYSSGDKVAEDTSGRWDLKETKFFRGTKDKVFWKLIIGPKVHPSGDSVNALTTHFDQQLQKTGVCAQSTRLGAPIILHDNTETTLFNALHEDLGNKRNKIPDIVVLLIQRKDQNFYSSFKYLTDYVFALQSICITEANLEPKKRGWANTQAISQYMANVAMKANLKGSGINHSARGVRDRLSDTLVIGADVTHPGSGALQGCPSIAAVVGSLDDSGGLFRGKLTLQPAKQEVRSFRSLLQQIGNHS